MIWRENLKLDHRCEYCSRVLKEHTLVTLEDFESRAGTGRMLYACNLVGNLEGEMDLMVMCIVPKGEEPESENPCTKAYLEEISNG